MLSLFILIPFVLVLLLNLPFKKLNSLIAFAVTLMVSFVQVGALLFAQQWLQTARVAALDEIFPFQLKLDPLSQVLLLTIGIISIAALIVGYSTFKEDKERFNFFNLFLLLISGMNGLCLVRDVFTMYVFIEITAVVSFILVAFNKDKAGLEGSFKYLVLSAIATILMLTAISLLVMTTGVTGFAKLNHAINYTSPNFLIILAVILYLIGLFIKGGLVPFHGWLPDAYSSAPHSVSILLAGIVTKVTGIYTIIRLTTDVFGFTTSIKETMLLIGIISAIVGASAALMQTDFKRMLAYSSISQVGYIILSLGTGTALGIAGAIFHLFNHSIFKAQLFVNAAAVESSTNTRDMDQMGGIAEKMPYTGWTSVVGFLSTSGIPPLSGFWSKLIIIIALWQSQNQTYAVLAVLVSLLTLGYFLYMQRRVFFGELGSAVADIKEAPLGLIIPAIILATISVGVGILFPFLVNSIIIPIDKII